MLLAVAYLIKIIIHKKAFRFSMIVRVFARTSQ